MNFKPTKKKIIIYIGITILWYILIFQLANGVACLCEPCPPSFNFNDCEKVFVFNIIPESNSCNCGCFCPEPTPIKDISFELFTIFSPGLLIYGILSLIEKEK
jgi:hypothetical protein